jgi:hypothetical protein
MSDVVIDAKGNVLAVGDRVMAYGFDPAKDKYEDFFGHITKITDTDGDVDDYGRGIMYPPYVYVKFKNGDEDHFISQTQGYGEEPFLCEDIDKVVEGGKYDQRIDNS